MPSVKLNVAGRPAGEELEVPDLGLFKNGETADVDDDAWERFKLARGEGNYPEGGTLVIDTEAIETEAEEHAEALEEAEQKADQEGVDALKKDELLAIATDLGVEGAEDMTVDELKTALGEGEA